MKPFTLVWWIKQYRKTIELSEYAYHTEMHVWHEKLTRMARWMEVRIIDKYGE